ncbi:uncharacterized protein N7473_006776 [Penicillium subrubescens]|uniref:Lysine-specific metallo-endopeptidase domain-containing protein n=1 Tax=Penicillium subrubescens TaxID=1316194 RepID=A0A1Q5UR55_9EURO|nr:uncharacterized protein N7473_006776 [Penicillium subrubescens]KAJ5890548.1 hypothetical protein N7473_006776 [Penicillium subrubescens]OKP14965.1 hypothetical protein PENSUB_4310 [Penicillium subrubescens]
MATMATMTWSKVMLLLSFILLQVAWVDAYSIDDSCAPIKDTLVEAVKNSMKLAEDAGTALDGNDPNVNELKGWFFAGYRLDTVRAIYKNVQEFKNLKNVDLNNNHDPILYCDLSRYEETTITGDDGKEQTVLFDKTTKLLVPKSKEYDGCKTGDTVAYRSAQVKDGQLVKNSIQLCPWYLTVLGHSAYATIDTVTNHKNLNDYNPKRPLSAGEPNADVFGSRLDVSLLHEFSHALADDKGHTLDWAYRWEGCMSAGPTGCNNAESISYFAMGVQLINKKAYFTKEGKMDLLSRKPKPGKRDVQMVMRPWTG